MIGLFILFITICLYNSSSRPLALAIFIGFLDADYGGYCIITNEITSINNIDLALIFGIYVILKEKNNISITNDTIGKKIIIYFLFTICVFIFSLTYYHLSTIESLQNGRIFMLLPLVYFTFQCQSYRTLNNTITYVYRFIALSSFLYILQIIFSTPIMPYFLDISIHKFMGISVPRFYNFPPFISSVCIMIFHYTALLNKREIKVYKLLYIGALICTFGRTLILTVIFAVILVKFLKIKSIKWSMFLLISILLLVMNYIMSSNIDNRTILDIKNSFSGDFINNPYGINGDSTLSFRFAWFYERIEHLIHAPIWEQLFGLGWFSEENANNLYSFIIGLRSNKGQVVQLYTPDISYGLLLVRLGIAGLIIYLYLVYSILKEFIKNRRINSIYILISVLLISNIILGFSGLVIAYPFSFSLLFILYFISNKYKYDKNIQSYSHNYHRNL